MDIKQLPLVRDCGVSTDGTVGARGRAHARRAGSFILILITFWLFLKAGDLLYPKSGKFGDSFEHYIKPPAAQIWSEVREISMDATLDRHLSYERRMLT